LQGRAFATEPFTFHNQSSFIDESKVLHVLGEIKNGSTKPMKDILITASFYDKSGKLLGLFKRPPALQVIDAGESSPFEVPYIDQKSVDSVTNFTLSATGQATEGKEKVLKIVSVNSRLDLLGTYYINAVARNDGQDNATNAIMIATLYDNSGSVISIGKALAEASPGSSDILPGTKAAFGIAITDKSQTYKTARYSLIVDSDTYVSDREMVEATGPGLSSSSRNNNNQSTSGCLIVTAAFGSELAPQVRELRSFRDSIVLQTFAGHSFMNVFNQWYYSFSPQVADYERDQPWLRSTVRTIIYPLLGILDLSAFVYETLAFSTEMAIVSAGITASTLIGVIYFAPVGLTIGVIKRRRHWNMAMAYLLLTCVLLASIATIIIAELVTISEVMMLGTALLVLSTIWIVILAISRMIRG